MIYHTANTFMPPVDGHAVHARDGPCTQNINRSRSSWLAKPFATEARARAYEATKRPPGSAACARLVLGLLLLDVIVAHRAACNPTTGARLLHNSLSRRSSLMSGHACTCERASACACMCRRSRTRPSQILMILWADKSSPGCWCALAVREREGERAYVRVCIYMLHDACGCVARVSHYYARERIKQHARRTHKKNCSHTMQFSSSTQGVRSCHSRTVSLANIIIITFLSAGQRGTWLRPLPQPPEYGNT